MDLRPTESSRQPGSLPVVAIAGRPNVGKSTLFNRIVGRRKAIVQKEKGTTRDSIQEAVSWQNKAFLLTDTGGLEFAPKNTLQAAVESQAEEALRNADLILWVVDEQEGIIPLDERIAEKLRRADKKIILVSNKSDSAARDFRDSDCYRLGIPDVFKVSALHGHGTGDLLDRIAEILPDSDGYSPNPWEFTLAIAGEPNSGKSTYLNRILGKSRALVSSVPGTTRDCITETLSRDGRTIRIVDTAGFRTRDKVKEASTFFSISRTQQAIQESDLVLLFFDATRGFTKTSKVIAGLVRDAGRGVVLVANKWDLSEKGKDSYAEEFKEDIPFLTECPLEFISALNGENIEAPIRSAFALWENYARRISTRALNETLRQILRRKPPPPPAKISFLLQTGVRPPSFVFFCRHLKRIPDHYALYLKNSLSEKFRLGGLPIRIRLKEADK
ncbi:MAG TPA: ribosome biogenesis GTPase Der [Candidatus Omnitrophota bacterium]|nr:ribosome biogenesis GTPase Der [Candidatus Omnitrophota bacterium]